VGFLMRSVETVIGMRGFLRRVRGRVLLARAEMPPSIQFIPHLPLSPTRLYMGDYEPFTENSASPEWYDGPPDVRSHWSLPTRTGISNPLQRAIRSRHKNNSL
jgi:hypothetical protein